MFVRSSRHVHPEARVERLLTLELLGFALVLCLAIGELTACSSPTPLTPAEAAAATKTVDQTNAAANAVANSRYRTYRWMTSAEMAKHGLGNDPTMRGGRRDEVEQSIDAELASRGYQKGEPADFTVTFSDAYLDTNVASPLFGAPIYPNPQERFTIVFFDAQTGRLLWRGWGTEDLKNGKQSGKAIVLAVSHALAQMPVPLAP